MSAVSRERYSIWPLLAGFLILHVVAAVFDQVMDDSPGLGLVAIMVGGPIVIAISLVWLFLVGAMLVSRRWKRGVSYLFGPVAGCVLVIAMARFGYPPWRVWFEFARPYYATRIWLMHAGSTNGPIAFTQVDKELWSGHESRTITYDRNATISDGPPTCRDGSWTRRTNLQFGFYAEEVQTSYVDACP